ncbi:hypothetical protein [Acerihabitans arboris]|uniref:Uncharacterized protein n=1 Tax=Acerihabitans arboris TaxID=2691583 RepID=A0A845SQX3_9GAMM|nr:hypothetical protein [Acerihabitans arboris]NDL65517.1 hypothetical protein [Acerihabitans arboris]
MQNTGLKGENFWPGARHANCRLKKDKCFQVAIAGLSSQKDQAGSAVPPMTIDKVKKQAMMVLSTINGIKHRKKCTNQQKKGASRLWIVTVVPVY